MSDQFCLKWNNHHTTLVAVFDKLFECESLVDCTVAAEGKFVKAHKVVLSACSSYLEELLQNHDDKHPILIFNDISYVELKAMLEYMYRGEVNVSQDQLNTFLKAAEALRIKGLTTDQGGGDGGGGGELNDLKKKMPRKEARTNSPVLGTTPVERPPSPKRKRRMSSRDENYANDSNSCDTAPTPPPASGHNAVTKLEEKLSRLKREGGGAETASVPGTPSTGGVPHKLLQPKTEFVEEPSNMEDVSLEDEEDYGPNPGTSQASFSSQDFNNWQLGEAAGDEVFMAGQHDLNNTAGNSQVSRRKAFSSEEPASKKCNCLYCALKKESKEKLPSAIGKPSSFIGNPKYEKSSVSTRDSPPSVIGNGSVIIKRVTSTENSEKSIAPKPVTKNYTSFNGDVELPDDAASDLPTPKPLQKPHKCVCGNSYTRRDHLTRHRKSCRTTLEPSKIKCECGMGFDCVYNLVRHKEENCPGRQPARKTFTCECRYVFEDYDSLLEHQKTVCRKRRVVGSQREDEGHFQCECGLSYTSMGSLAKHRKTVCFLKKAPKVEPRQLTHSCECGRKFVRSDDLTRHKSVCEFQAGDEDAESEGEEEQEDDDINTSTFKPYSKRDKSEPKPISRPSRNLSCRCGKPYGSYSTLAEHQRDCSFTDSSGGSFRCLCDRVFPRLCHLARHMDGCSFGSKARRRQIKVESKAPLRCKCGSQYSNVANLRRHMRISCSLYKNKTNLAERRGGRPPGSKKLHVRGSQVVHSKKWGIIRGPPFVCTCGASYLNYVSLAFHKRHNMCKISDSNVTLRSSKSQKQPTNNGESRSTVNAVGYPEVGDVFDLSTAVKFRCACGQEFYSKFSLNGHTRHCKDYRRPEKCSMCQAVFSSRAHLVRHVKTAHRGVSNIKVGAKVKKIVAISPKSKPKSSLGLAIRDVRSLAGSS